MPTALAVQPCTDVVCVWAGTIRNGAGSCDHATPFYAEATEVTIIVGIAASTYVSLFSDCYRDDRGASSEGYRELAVVASAAGRDAALAWSQSDGDGSTQCRIRTEADTARSVPCPAGGPPMLPALPALP
jgi:hypothetical protein